MKTLDWRNKNSTTLLVEVLPPAPEVSAAAVRSALRSLKGGARSVLSLSLSRELFDELTSALTQLLEDPAPGGVRLYLPGNWTLYLAIRTENETQARVAHPEPDTCVGDIRFSEGEAARVVEALSILGGTTGQESPFKRVYEGRYPGMFNNLDLIINSLTSPL